MRAGRDRGAGVTWCARRDGVDHGPGTVFVPADVARMDDVRRLAATAQERFGPPDVWVNNAGLFGPVGPLEDSTPDEVAEALRVNVAGVVNGMRAIADLWASSAAAGGTVVNVVSGAARHPYPGGAVYSATKAAVAALTESWAHPSSRSRVRALAVSPGALDTEMQEQLRSTDPGRFPDAERLRRRHAEGTLGDPAAVAAAILDLAADPPPGWWHDVAASGVGR